MRRKLIYIITIMLTITLVVTEQFVNPTANETNIKDLSKYIEEETNPEEGVTYSLTIKNVQNDDNNYLYAYKIKIDNLAGAYRYKYNDEERYMVFSANGEAQIFMNENEELIIYDLPSNYNYYIEQASNVSNMYTTTVNGQDSTIITGKITKNTKTTFENRTIIKDIVEEPEEKKENPQTEDSITPYIVISVLAFILCLMFSTLRIKRFE